MHSARVFRHPGKQAGAREQIEVTCQGGCIPGVLELSQHFGVRQDLPG